MNPRKKTAMTWMFNLLVVLGAGLFIDYLFFDFQSGLGVFLIIPFLLILAIFSIGMLAARVENFTDD